MEVELAQENRETTVIDVRLISQMDANEVYQASMSGCVSSLNALLLRNPLALHQLSLTSFTETPLHIAALLGHHLFAAALLEKKRTLASELDSLGRSPLHLACAEGHLEIVKELLVADAEACMVADLEERLPLHLAAMSGRLDVIGELIRVRPEAARETVDGDTVLHLCVRYGRFESLRAIVQLSESSSELLAAKDRDGNTVLHLAAMLNQKRTIKYLVSLPGVEAHANTENNNGLTALDVLERHCPTRDFKTLEIRDILVQAGVTTTANTTANNVVRNSNSNNVVVPNPNNVAAAETREQNNRERDVRGSLMVVLTVIVAMLYQAGMNPPGGVWSENSVSAQAGYFNCTTNNTCIAGTALLAYTDTDSYVKLVIQNTLTLCICLVIIAWLLISQRSNYDVTVFLVSLLVMILAHAYLQVIVFVTPKFVLEDHGHGMLQVQTIWCFRILFMLECFIISALMPCILFFRFNYWLQRTNSSFYRIIINLKYVLPAMIFFYLLIIIVL